LIKLSNCVEPCGKNCRRQVSPISTTQQLSKEPWQNATASSATRKLWEHMQTFYSSFKLWPSTEWPNSTWMEGGSLTVWTMLYPPMETTQLQTYAWDGHLENFIPGTACTQEGTRPPLISQAMWRKGSNLSLLQTSTKVFQKSGPSLANPTGLLQPTSTPITIVPPHITKSTVPTNISSVLAALMAYLLLVQQSSNTEPATQQLLPTPPRQWRNPGISRVQVGMSWKSCLRRTMAIIQR